MTGEDRQRVGIAEIARPDGAERACAVVACRCADDPLSFDEISAFLRDQGLMIQKLAEQLELPPELPRNPTGKILKHELRKMGWIHLERGANA